MLSMFVSEKSIFLRSMFANSILLKSKYGKKGRYSSFIFLYPCFVINNSSSDIGI